MSEPEFICQRYMEVLDFTEVGSKLLEELGIAPGGPFQMNHGSPGDQKDQSIAAETSFRKRWYSRGLQVWSLIVWLFLRLFDRWRYVVWRLRSRGKDEDSLEPFVVEPVDALDEAADWLIITCARFETLVLAPDGQVFLGPEKIIGPKCRRKSIQALKKRLARFRSPVQALIGAEPGEWTVWIEGEPNGTVSILCSKGWEQNP
jgi:hypothetical protein